jgi:predicted phosphodiesterase
MTKTEIAADIVRKNPRAPMHSLARKVVQSHPDVFTAKQAENAVRRVLGLASDRERKTQLKSANKDLVRARGTTTWKPSFPPSAAEPWAPRKLPTPCVVLSLSDLHVPYHDQRAIETAVKYAKKRHKITDLVLNGDYGDFYQISRFNRDPRKRSLKDELDTQRAGLEWLAKQFPKAARWYKMGNHDVRWDIWVWQRAAELADVEQIQLHSILEFARLGFVRVNDEPIMAGKLPILHGHELNSNSSVQPARAAFNKTLHSVLVGHHHRTSSHGETNMWHDERMAWSQGCLCDMNPEYARVNKWNQGFAVIEVAKDGTYNLFNYRIGGDYAVRQS